MAKTIDERLRSFKRIGLVVLGSAVLGLGAGFFLSPNNIVTGGLTGLGIILENVLRIGLGVDAYVAILQVLFFILGWIFLGKNMAIKTAIATVVYPLTLSIGSFLTTLPLFSSFFVEGGIVPDVLTINFLISAVFGGVLVGVGVGLTFLGGGSTGGVDILVLILQKITKQKTSILTFITDGMIVVVGLIVLQRIDLMLIGLISAFVTSIMIDRIFDTEDNVSVSVISKKYQEINEIVLQQFQRGSTIVEAIGGYSQQSVKMLIVVLDMREYYLLEEIVAKVDPQAFMYMTKAGSVRGEGFKALAITDEEETQVKENE
jgi:uncharacterized membrane-anchored protein YitT (DUF2179 family)